MFRYVSYVGVIRIIVAHGLCSSGLFYLVNVVYRRTTRRSVLIRKGLLNLIPSISLGWFFILIYNISAPPSLNLLAEVFLVSSLVS